MDRTGIHCVAACFEGCHGNIVDSPYFFLSDFGAFLVVERSNYFQLFLSCRPPMGVAGKETTKRH
ncbi:hypothetical protein EI613_18035 [Azospirillum sp. 412522]|nr:hypothetical protein [Azospirillum sp. 412522]